MLVRQTALSASVQDWGLVMKIGFFGKQNAFALEMLGRGRGRRLPTSRIDLHPRSSLAIDPFYTYFHVFTRASTACK